MDMRSDKRNERVQTQSAGSRSPYPPVISLTMTIVENGVFAAAAKKPPMPTITKAAGFGTREGAYRCRMMPSAPPPQPPITIDGPKTPPEPPLPIVRLVVAIFPRAMAIRIAAVPAVPPDSAFWSAS